MLGLRGVRSTLAVSASSQTIAAASSSVTPTGAAGEKGSEPGRKSSAALLPPLACTSSWISGSGSAAASSGSTSTSTISGTRRPSARATSPTITSAISAFSPWPAPRNLTTYNPSSSASTRPGIEPPSRSGVT